MNATATIRPTFILYHANAKGTGCALRMELHPAHDNVDGSIGMTFANQCVIGNRTAANPTYPRFDWENPIRVCLCFDDLCQMLQVFRGETESINDGKGLFHTKTEATTRIVFRHVIEPICGYSLEVYRTSRNGGEDNHAHFMFSPAEACGVCEVFAGVMPLIAFGDPATY